MTKNTLIAKPIVKNQFWIITNGKEKVGNVLANGSGFELKLNGNKTQFKNTNAIAKKANIEFTSSKINKVPSEVKFSKYPTTNRVFNSILDIKRKLHIYTKTQKSKCYYAAGWYSIKQNTEYATIFCPKYIFIQIYTYYGPFMNADDVKIDK